MTRAILAALLLSRCVPTASAHDLEADPAPRLVSVATAPDLEAEGWGRRFRIWQPRWIERYPGELATVVDAVLSVCRAADAWPSRERCPALMLGLAMRESSLRADAVGARGEIGVWQIWGAALAGETRAAAFDVQRNAELAQAWLKTADRTCRRAGWGRREDFEERVLGAYASGSCVTSRGARMVMRWAEAVESAGMGGQS